MIRKIILLGIVLNLLTALAWSQTTSGNITGTITDPSGAVVPGASIVALNTSTGVSQTTTSGANGNFLLPQLTPGTYTLRVTKPGFAAQITQPFQLQVNQSLTDDFQLALAKSSQTVTVTGAPPQLNTTSATLSTVIGHHAIVNLPLNGREFTQLALLAPGASPIENGQQGAFVVSLGAGGISPSVDGQRGEQNNFTMDGILNNQVYTNTWIISPPPEAIKEFNVQTHITNAEFAISTGANINVVTRSGTNEYHGDLWEFARNDIFDAQTYPATTRLPYTQNQYGLYLGGPLTIPRLFNGHNNTWFSGYWEGFRSSLTNSYFANVPTAAMRAGNFSAVLGPQVGTDSLGRPEYANEIYDPLTSTPDPANPGEYLRNPFPNNTIPASMLNPATLAYLNKYYPLPNMNVAANVFPNYQFSAGNNTASDDFGIRFDHDFRNHDSLFLRFNRSNQNLQSPEGLPTYRHNLRNYAQQIALGYTHIFNPTTIMNLHVGYSYINYNSEDEPAGTAFARSINSLNAFPAHAGIQLAPGIGIANGFTGVGQFAVPLGPMETLDYHLDLTKVKANNTIGVGAMYYHLRTYDDGWTAGANFTQNATAQDAIPGPTGYGMASFMLGTMDSYSPWLGNTAADQTVGWWGLYAQDKWQVSRKLVLTAGLRWDYVSPPNYHKIVSGLDVLNGRFIVTGPVLPYYPNATGPSGFFKPQYNGYEPRFGFAYRAARRTVVHGAFAMLDDHNNTLVQENQNIRLSWPTGIAANFTSLDLGVPEMYLNNLPTASSIIGKGIKPYASYGADPNNKIPYVMEYNLGIQEQLASSTVLNLAYVGSLGRHQYIVPEANTAVTPGPGSISNRQPFPQYGGPFSFSWNEMPSSYNALQAQLTRTYTNGLEYMVSYTWSKSEDWASDPYTNNFPNFYNLADNWGPSSYNKTNMLVFSSVYELPFGRGRKFFAGSKGITNAILGDWTLSGIVTLDSGSPFSVFAGADVANTGGPAQRAERTGADPYSGPGFVQNRFHWLNPAAFTEPAKYTFGNERRNDVVGPGYADVDADLSKTFRLYKRFHLQIMAEFFNLFNRTNLGNPDSTLTDSTFDQILGAAPGRVGQFAAKLKF